MRLHLHTAAAAAAAAAVYKEATRPASERGSTPHLLSSDAGWKNRNKTRGEEAEEEGRNFKHNARKKKHPQNASVSRCAASSSNKFSLSNLDNEFGGGSASSQVNTSR